MKNAKNDYIMIILQVVFLGLTVLAFKTVLFPEKPEYKIIYRCECGTVTIDTSDEGICYFNNGFQTVNHIIDCKDKPKILRRVCK